jgi:septum formation protein
MKKIILASTSPRRKELLEKIRLKFDIVDSNYIEDLTLNKKPVDLVKYLSLGKAMAVVEKYLDSIIISADTIVVYKNKVLGKPKTKKQAREFLSLLSGKTHSVITAFSIIDSKTSKKITKAISTKITMKKLIGKEIDWYIKSGEPMDKAGAYAIQGLGSMFIKKISGDYFATVGMPIFDIARELKKFGIDVLKD